MELKIYTPCMLKKITLSQIRKDNVGTHFYSNTLFLDGAIF
jgi:hypothetical protein